MTWETLPSRERGSCRDSEHSGLEIQRRTCHNGDVISGYLQRKLSRTGRWGSGTVLNIQTEEDNERSHTPEQRTEEAKSEEAIDLRD